MCRYNGACSRFYSVAEHSIHCAKLLEARHYTRQECFEALMHDASETYLPDLASPIKMNSELGEHFRRAEDGLMRVIACKYGFRWPVCTAAQSADIVLLWCEAAVLMHSSGKTWDGYSEGGESVQRMNSDVRQWVSEGIGDPDTVRLEFLRLFSALRPQEIPHTAFVGSPAGGV
jgi:hypothetical protein